MNSAWVLVDVIVAVGLLYVVAPVVLNTYRRYRAPRSVTCPETGMLEEIELDADLAAARSAFGKPELRVKHCSRLTPGHSCTEECLNQVE